MGLSLEVKKFINSENTGAYVEIVLPGEPEIIEPKQSRPEKPAKEKKKTKKQLREEEELLREAEQEDTTAEWDDIGHAGSEYLKYMRDPEPEIEPEPEPELEPESGPVMRYDTARMHYTEAGTGEPLILIHTVGQSYYTWRKLFYRLSEHYRVIALDLLGHGYSDRPAQFDYTIQSHAASIKSFMDAMGIQSAHFLAFSLGGAYALELALTHPEMVGRIVLLAPGGVSAEMPTLVKMVDSTLMGPIASMLYGVRGVEALLCESMFDLTNIDRDVVNEYYRPASDSQGRRCIRLSLHNFDDEYLTTHLRDVNADVLMLQGSEDKWRSAVQAEMYHAAMPNARYAMIRNAGHLMQEEKPERVVAALLEFIPVPAPEME